MLSKFNLAACENLLPWRKSIHLIFLGEKTDSGTKTGFHGNLRHCNCSLPQSHSLLCAGSGSPSDPLSHFNKLRRQKNIHFFRLASFILSLCAEKAIQMLKGAGMHSWDREKGPGPQHPAVRSVLPGNLQPVCWIPTIWNYFLGPSFVLQWCIIMLDEILWFTRKDTAKGLGNPCFKGYVQNCWVLFSWLICSVYMKIKSFSTRETHFGYIQEKDLESQHLMVVRNITPLLKSA